MIMKWRDWEHHLQLGIMHLSDTLCGSLIILGDLTTSVGGREVVLSPF